MPKKPKKPVKLKLRKIPVIFKNAQPGEARAEGTDAAWTCKCGERLPLLGRCWHEKGKCYTKCPTCETRYRVARKGTRKYEYYQAGSVEEI